MTFPLFHSVVRDSLSHSLSILLTPLCWYRLVDMNDKHQHVCQCKEKRTVLLRINAVERAERSMLLRRMYWHQVPLLLFDWRRRRVAQEAGARSSTRLVS